jgi:hypothetical protein
VASDPWFGGAGAQGVLPLGGGIRFAALGALGRRGDGSAGRAEASLQVVLDPGAGRRTPTWYAGGGVAARTGRDPEGFVLAVIGLEGPIGRQARWWAEAGIGGGGRVAAGYRWHPRAKQRGRPPR